jgi:hypothetical protein
MTRPGTVSTVVILCCSPVLLASAALSLCGKNKTNNNQHPRRPTLDPVPDNGRVILSRDSDNHNDTELELQLRILSPLYLSLYSSTFSMTL